jgi:hypothetical protein
MASSTVLWYVNVGCVRDGSVRPDHRRACECTSFLPNAGSIGRLQCQKVSLAGPSLRDPDVHVCGELDWGRCFAFAYASNTFAVVVDGGRYVPDLARSPDNDSRIVWCECEGGVGAHGSGYRAEVVGQTVPDVVN